MKLLVSILVLSIGCGSGGAADEEALVCEQPLPATDADGAPWPSFSEANTLLTDCSQLDGYWSRSRGSCDDGKLFLARGSGFVGDTYYFDGETLVGVAKWTDIISPCGGAKLGDIACDEGDMEEISCPVEGPLDPMQ